MTQHDLHIGPTWAAKDATTTQHGSNFAQHELEIKPAQPKCSMPLRKRENKEHQKHQQGNPKNAVSLALMFLSQKTWLDQN